MTARRRASAAALLGAAALALALWPVPVLEIRNDDRGLVRFFGAGGASRWFAVTFIHSMYDAAVEERFEVTGGHIELREVASDSAAAREYLGLTGLGRRQPVGRSMERIVYRVAMGAPQHLLLAGAERSFLEFGAPGDRLIVKAARLPLAAALLGGAQ